MILYHGSTEIVQKPQFGIGKSYNDYGQGFYCTENVELAKEWACRNRSGGFVNKYKLECENLKVLDLTSEDYSILHWLTLLIMNREVRVTTPVMKRGQEWLYNHYQIEDCGFDIVKGYRADDSYFAFVRSFLNNEITLEQFHIAIHLGNLGIQWMLKSSKVFEKIQFQEYEIVQGNLYYGKRKQRDEQARKAYNKMLEDISETGTYLAELIKG